MVKIELALAHLNTAEEELLSWPKWKRWLLGITYDYLLNDCLGIAQIYLKEALEEAEKEQ